MSAFEEQPVVGLFGTCGDSTFRQDLFIPRLEAEGIPYYNPQLGPGEWDPSCSAVEADHLAFDVVQLWPVTSETLGSASLTEQGYSIAASIRSDSPLPKSVVVKIDKGLDDLVEPDNPVARKESLRARGLGLEHLMLNAGPDVYVVDTMEEMIDTGVILFQAAEKAVDLRRGYNPAYQRFVDGRNERLAYRQAMESGMLGPEVARIAQS